MTMTTTFYDYSTTPDEDIAPAIGDPAEPLWRSRRNARILSAVNRIGQRAAESTARTDRLRAAKRRQERLVQHLPYDPEDIIRVVPTTARSAAVPGFNHGSHVITTGTAERILRDLPAALESVKDTTDSQVDKWLDHQIMAGGDRWRRLLSLLRRQSALLSPAARSQLQLSESEETLVQRALETEAEAGDEDGWRTARRQLMLQVWQREADHRQLLEGAPTRRSSEPRPEDAAGQAGRRCRSAEPPETEPVDWTAVSQPPSPPAEPDEQEAPAPPSFPMQHPGKEVEIQETQIQITERRENEWTAEWDWAERERRARSRVSEVTSTQVSQISVSAESSQVSVQSSEVVPIRSTEQQPQQMKQGKQEEQQQQERGDQQGEQTAVQEGGAGGASEEQK